MKKIFLLGMLFPLLSFGQTNNKIEGLVIDTPCELEYTRNLGNQNNYSCVIQKADNKIFQYSITVQNLFEKMKGLTGNSLQIFKDEFLKSAKNNATANGESAEFITLNNQGIALKTESYLTYSGNKFKNLSIVLLYKQKSYVVNLTTNDLNSSGINKLVDRIEIR
ncbi:MAG TPA: hypothetical protein VIM94_03270 [Salegentibacter sp.]|uniref:hypothetical protein n=1 Tax=Salegentibacter sp. TaxID=1903072 RepID=UPI002F92D37F